MPTEEVPVNARGNRDPNFVKPVVLRMGTPYIKQLDSLCLVNKRSRRELLEILISEAHAEWESDRNARINPL